MPQTQSALQVNPKTNKLAIPRAWEEYASRVMADLLSRELNREVNVVPASKCGEASEAVRPRAQSSA